MQLTRIERIYHREDLAEATEVLDASQGPLQRPAALTCDAIIVSVTTSMTRLDRLYSQLLEIPLQGSCRFPARLDAQDETPHGLLACC